MNQENGGLHQLNNPPQAETWLESGLKEVAGAVAALFADARTIDPRTDEYGHARSRAYSDAVTLLKASAKVGHTIAELRGNKFEHTINVRREQVPAPESAIVPNPPGFGFQGRIRLTDGRVCMRASHNRWRIIEDDDDPRGHDSQPIFQASNGNSAKAQTPASVVGEDAIAAFDAAGPNATDVQREAAAKALEQAVAALDSGQGRATGFEDGTPTPISGGSNGNFGADEAANGAGGWQAGAGDRPRSG
jgi:hypothetical protein